MNISAQGSVQEDQLQWLQRKADGLHQHRDNWCNRAEQAENQLEEDDDGGEDGGACDYDGRRTPVPKKGPRMKMKALQLQESHVRKPTRSPFLPLPRFSTMIVGNHRRPSQSWEHALILIKSGESSGYTSATKLIQN